MKSQLEPGIVKEFSIIFIQVIEKSRKADYLAHVLCSLALCKAVCNVVVPFVSSKREFYPFA